MRRVVSLDAIKDPPDTETMLRRQGIPEGTEIAPGVRTTLGRAVEIYSELAEPRAIWSEILPAQFETVFRGDGHNAGRTPLQQVFPRADRLTLYALTLGEALSRRISEFFGRNEPALGYALDSVASERADAAADLLGRRLLGERAEPGQVAAGTRVLAYSPGYCGWHITGQRALFDFLQPQRIGISLNDRCLMLPLKSVSGVLVAGHASIHGFDNDFDFCDCCTTHACRERLAARVDGGPVWKS